MQLVAAHVSRSGALDGVNVWLKREPETVPLRVGRPAALSTYQDGSVVSMSVK